MGNSRVGGASRTIYEYVEIEKGARCIPATDVLILPLSLDSAKGPADGVTYTRPALNFGWAIYNVWTWREEIFAAFRLFIPLLLPSFC